MTTNKLNLDEELADIQRQSNENLKLIKGRSFEVDLSEWLTIARYAKKYTIDSHVITNWIRRCIIPNDCVMEFPELNHIRLIKDQLYK
ncbi:hypothetical protein [Spirosoma areae]